MHLVDLGHVVLNGFSQPRAHNYASGRRTGCRQAGTSIPETRDWKPRLAGRSEEVVGELDIISLLHVLDSGAGDERQYF